MKPDPHGRPATEDFSALDGLMARYEAPAPGDEFADRVMSAWDAEDELVPAITARPSWWGRRLPVPAPIAVSAIAVAACLLILVAIQSSPSRPSPSDRETHAGSPWDEGDALFAAGHPRHIVTGGLANAAFDVPEDDVTLDPEETDDASTDEDLEELSWR